MSTPYVRHEEAFQTQSPSLLSPPAVYQHPHHTQHHPRTQHHSDAGPSCYERKKGCNRAFVWSWCLFINGSVLFLIMVLIPTLVSIVMQQQICDQLCVPIPAENWVENITNPDDWKINNWLVNSNRSQWPVEYFNVYLYNITNSAAVVAGLEPKLKVAVVGPYVFSVYRQKYNVSFSEDHEQVFFEDLESHMFMPEKSKGLQLTDVLNTLDMPLVSLNYMLYTKTNQPMSPVMSMGCTSDPNTSCLFQKSLTVQQILFGYSNSVYNFANSVMKNILAPQFQLFFNYSTNIAEAHALHLVSSFGMGGSNHQILTNMAPGPVYVSGRPNVNDSVHHGQYTGQGDSFGQMMEYFQILGNTSINVWNGPEFIGGTDHFQFAPPVTPESILTIWDADVFRQVDLQFQEKVSVLGKYDAYRFTPTDDLFSGVNPHYYGNSSDDFGGLLFVSPVSVIPYGAPISASASRPYQAGVTPRWSNTVECVNCPDMSNPSDWLNNYMDVEPNTGKVIGGRKRGQINVLIGQPEIYNSSTGAQDYAKLRPTLLPVVFFEYTSIVEEGDQTKQLDDGLDQINLAKTATAIGFYALSVLAFVCYFAAFLIGLKADANGACFDRSTYKPALHEPLL